jgi:hypothetical protein
MLEVATTPLSSGKPPSSSSITRPCREGIAGGISSKWRIKGWCDPNISPAAMRNRRE